ncbi:MAG: DUF6306 domain-containing protein [Spirochaetia bacterium]|jgi:hypothetical protein|nr:DUF6306 domain-containing protein [Spirochaetia bacterium]
MAPEAQDPIAFLNRLLEAERAGVKVLATLLPELQKDSVISLAKNFLHDEGMNCQILKTLIENLGGTASSNTGDFVQKVAALQSIEEKLALLIRGQEWVASYIRKNRRLLSKTSERLFLEAMKIQHEENVDILTKLLSN